MAELCTKLPSHIPSNCRSVTLHRFFAVLWTSRYGDPAGNSFFGLIKEGRKGLISVWSRDIGVDLSDLVDISIVPNRGTVKREEEET
ncbi:hypothetical protein KCU85_g145, partial [Aureobasidium melanogenum]